MYSIKTSAFENILLIAVLAVAILGFKLINEVYVFEGQRSWLMLIAIFTWLMLIVLFASLSISVDLSKKQYEELKELKTLIKIESRKKRLR